MDYFFYHLRHFVDGRTGIIISLLLASIQQPVVLSRPDVSVPSASGRAGPFETCVNATSGEAGLCMFAMDCFRARGRHVGICTKGFYFGSCCSLPTYYATSTSTAKTTTTTTTTTSTSLSSDQKPTMLVSTSSPPPTQSLPRVPIILESNAIDGPAAALPPTDPLDLSFWPDLLADIYGLKPQPIHSHLFPYSTFHAPVINGKPTTSTVATSSSTTTTTTTTTTPSTTTLTTTTLTTTNTTTAAPSSISSTAAQTVTTTKPTAWIHSANASGAANVTVIYANATTMVESEIPGTAQVESWLEEIVETTTSIPSTSTTTTRPMSTPTSGTPTPSTTPTSANPVTEKMNETLALLPITDATLQRDGSTTAVCGKPVYRWPKIVSGENARLGQWPWQVTIQEKTRRGYFHKCGASILSKEWVITAAHCLSNVQQENLIVRMGGIDFASVEDKWIESRVQYYFHPQFNIQTQQNDIALLKLVTPLVAYQSSTLPICLPEKDMEFEGDQSFVSGWGRLGEKSPISTRLQYVGVPIINNTECEKIYLPINKYIDRQSICAGYTEGLKDSCEGDSGGPMMVFKRGRWVLAGVISWGVGCARPNQPGVSTRVTEYLDWIQTTLNGGPSLT